MLHVEEEAALWSAAQWDGQFEFCSCKIGKGEDRDNKVSGDILTCSAGECHLPVVVRDSSPLS